MREKFGKALLLILVVLGFFQVLPLRQGLVALGALFGFYVLRRLGISASDLVGKPPPRRDWRVMFKYIFPLIVVSLGLGQLTVVLLSYIAPDFVLRSLAMLARFQTEPQFVFLALFVAPVVEEILFRGMIFPLLSRYWGVTAGLIGSSLIFGFFHLNVLGAAAFAVASGIFYVRTSSLWIPIALHFINNSIPVALSLMVEPTTEFTLAQIRQGLPGALLLSAVGGWAVLGFARRSWPTSLPLQFYPVRHEEEVRRAA